MNKPIDYYIGATLKALRPTQVYNLTGTPTRLVPIGSIVGEIDSYVQRNDGIYWLLKTNEMVKHSPGQFDARTAEYTGDGKTREIIENLSEIATGNVSLNPFNSLKDLKPILLIVGVIIAILIGLQLFTTYKILK